MASATFEDHPTDPDKVILRKPRFEEDDDIQDYKKPWVGLRAEEIEDIQDAVFGMKPHYVALARAVEAKLKEKNT
jgi:hypothetical protein